MNTLAPLRESAFVRFLGYLVTVIGTGFAVTTMWYGEQVTSKQWVYLMQAPGHKWFWGLWFGLTAFAAIAALHRRAYRTAAWALFINAFGAAGIAVFYLIGPLFENNLLTLGYWPWVMWCSIDLLLWAVNWRPVTW